MSRRLVAGLVALVLVVGGIAGNRLLLWMTAPLVSDASGVQPPIQYIDIPEGSTFRQVAVMLQQRGLIASGMSFRLLGKLTAAERKVIPGEYAFHAGMRPSDMLSMLVNGRVVLHPVTIPEGFRMAEIADLLAAKNLVDPQQFLTLTRDPAFIRTLNLDVQSLEGYLFPSTYHFPRGMAATDIIVTMVDAMKRVLTPELHARARDIGMSMHEVLTLASVVEKETGVDAERELVAAVFHNRLRRKIPLQSDPTVIYGLSAFDGNLKRRDLAMKSPYNTYRVAGLPPGPIANPGERSIRAALYPVPSTYLYFVSRNDGTHHFSSTLTEHNRAVDKYQRRSSRRITSG